MTRVLGPGKEARPALGGGGKEGSGGGDQAKEGLSEDMDTKGKGFGVSKCRLSYYLMAGL